MDEKQLNYITESLLNTYVNSSLINEEYISNLLTSLKESNDLGDVTQVIFTCKGIINDFLVEKAKSDENVLFELAIDMNSIKERLCLKLKLDSKNPKYDDYLMEGILEYDGSKSLDLYLSSYLMKKINTKYVPEKTDKKLEYINHSTNASNASDPKKVVEVTPIIVEKKDVKEEVRKETPVVEILSPELLTDKEERAPIQKQTSEEVTASVVLEEVFQEEASEMPSVEENSLEEMATEEQVHNKENLGFQTSSEEKCGSENQKPTKKQLKNQRRRAAKKENSTRKTEEENTFETPIEDLEELLTYEQEILEEEIEDITKDLLEPLEQKEEINENELDSKVSEIVAKRKGTQKENIVIKLYKVLGAQNEINVEDNILYCYYNRLRFGVYESFYTLEEIATILGIPLKEAIDYEEYTVNILKELLNKNLEKVNYLTLK